MIRRTIAEVHLDALRNNVAVARKFAGDRHIMAVVKANAYGHGLTAAALTFMRAGVQALAVAFANEGVMLRQAGIDIPILVLTPPFPDEAELYVSNNLDFVACSRITVDSFNEVAKRYETKAHAHIYVDTGMRRDGVDISELEPFTKHVAHCKHIDITGICTHHAASAENTALQLRQNTLFAEAVNIVWSMNIHPTYIHSANSGAVLSGQDTVSNTVRPGILLFGYSPVDSIPMPELRPAMTIKTWINDMRRLGPGEGISYSHAAVTSRETSIATLPIGYGDGLPWSLSGNAECLINGKRYPIVGRICMDECMVDIGDDDIGLGECVVILGTQDNETIDAREIAERCGTIHYEILTRIADRVPRVYIGEKQ